MTESVIPTLSGMPKSLFSNGHFAPGDDGGRVRFVLDAPERVLPRAEAARGDVEAALSSRLGRPVTLVLSSGEGASPAGSSAPSAGASTAASPASPAAAEVEDLREEDHIDVSELENATDVSTSGVDKLVQAFPGAEVIEQETS